MDFRTSITPPPAILPPGMPPPAPSAPSCIGPPPPAPHGAPPPSAEPMTSGEPSGPPPPPASAAGGVRSVGRGGGMGASGLATGGSAAPSGCGCCASVAPGSCIGWPSAEDCCGAGAPPPLPPPSPNSAPRMPFGMALPRWPCHPFWPNRSVLSAPCCGACCRPPPRKSARSGLVDRPMPPAAPDAPTENGDAPAPGAGVGRAAVGS